MAISITINTFTTKSDTEYEATGSVSGKPFNAETIIWQKAPIFKIVEPNEKGERIVKSLADSEFSRGERIAVARRLQAILKGESTVDAPVDLTTLKVKELKAECKARGIKGYSAKGVTKTDILRMLGVEVDAPEAEAVEAA